MKHAIAGTAGHIDHGKTALVRALTGVDTDRLQEEKRRGISIDIGFARLELARDLGVAIVDVPGHERFIKNMLAGVGGIDFVIFVVAADESIKPQTKEHFEICRLLQIPSGVVALTKSDLVDTDTLAVTKLEIEEFVKGSFLENAKILPVSAATGSGLAELRTEIEQLARRSVSRPSAGYLRLPVDRSFVMQGFGTIVTGTLLAGAVELEDEVQLYPGGQVLRVRSVQIHGASAKRAVAGQRTALNLSGINHHDIRRGMTIAAHSVLAANTVFDCALELLGSAKPLKNGAPVHFHSGTAEVVAKVRTLDGASAIEPGSSTFVRIALREPLLLLPGDRFIVRMFSPVTTIGGGKIIDCNPPRRIPGTDLAARASFLAGATLARRIEHFVAEAPNGLPIDRIMARTGVSKLAIPNSVHRFGDWLMSEAALSVKRASLRQTLTDFHRAHPLQPGMSKEELRTRLLPAAPPPVFDTLLSMEKQVVAEGEYLRLATHRIAFQSDEQQALDRIEQAFQAAGLKVPSVAEVIQASGIDAVRSRTLLKTLLRDKRLVRISEDLIFHVSAIDALKHLLAAHKGARFTVGEFKDWTGVSRKYAIPLLEWSDSQRLTRRDGDARVVVKDSGEGQVMSKK